mgnify:CR=1 FL=1|jgi:toxin ParE1/3/4
MMGNRYDVKITPQALRQMQEIKQYIRVTLQAPNSAQKWLEQMKKEISTLSSMPARIPLVEDEPWHTQGIHKMAVRNHLVYFWIDDEDFCVWIIAVIYGRRDQRGQLEELEVSP